MDIAFYAPLKPPDHPVPSGDRRIARLLMTALTRAGGHQVRLASRLRAWDGAGDPANQAKIMDRAARIIERFTRRPDLWFTYHLYDKAPDLIGPAIAGRLGIPYVVAEASVSPRRAEGPWQAGYAAVIAALRQAAAVIGLNPADAAGIRPYLAEPGRYHALPPFIDAAPFAAARLRRGRTRRDLSLAHGLDPDIPWLVVLAMMRPGAKLASYQVLARSLEFLTARPWAMLVIGDGVARDAVLAELARFESRMGWLGRTGPSVVPMILAACDLLVWPAIDEAFGMALLEAQAAGLPIVAGWTEGAAALALEGKTGLLARNGDAEGLAQHIASLLDDPARRRAMGSAAAGHIAAHHDIDLAARRLDTILGGLS